MLLLPLLSKGQGFEKPGTFAGMQFFSPDTSINYIFMRLRGDTLVVIPGNDINFINVGDMLYKVVRPAPYLENVFDTLNIILGIIPSQCAPSNLFNIPRQKFYYRDPFDIHEQKIYNSNYRNL